MKPNFLILFTFLFFQKLGLSIVTTSSNVTCIPMERQSLLLFKQSLKDNVLSTWSGLECCEWHGVGCDIRNGHVAKLDLRDKGLRGELSHSLQNLKHLRYLDLSCNYFPGNIPEFIGLFQRLEYLNLAGSFDSGAVPHHLGNLSRLEYLNLRDNNAIVRTSAGNVKTRGLIIDDLEWVSSLSSLRYLDLSGVTVGKHIDWFRPVNKLPSLLTLNMALCDINIPLIGLVNFTSLNSLDLSFNYIDSTIPNWLSNLTGLMHLNLHKNHFQGKIPGFIGMFSALVTIDLSFNFFDTSIPDMLCNLSSLVHLNLSRNMFSGPIPASVGQLRRLEDLYLGYNRLTGNIPMSLGQLSNLKNLDLSRNSLVGVLSETHFTKLKNLNYLVLSWNSLALNFSFQWIAPFQLWTFSASSCNIGPHFPNWLQTQKNLQTLHLSNSSIKDTIPEWFENILSQFLDLDLSNNQIGGKLPRFHGISSTPIRERILKLSSNKFEGLLVSFPSNVKLLDLSDNLLSGHVPETNATMNPSLQIVDLSKNRLTGSIPVHLCKVRSILVLDLSQNNFSGRLPGCFGNLIKLFVIDLSNNTLSGAVPSSLGSLKDLNSLHLNNNKFEGGIPKSLQNLIRLDTMDLGYNSFTGTIPSWIGETLYALRFLNLQSNKLTGKIPLQLCQLNALQYLSLARNNITGTIPQCFWKLSSMKVTNFEQGFSYIQYASSYQENIFVTMKGMELVYTKTRKFLKSLDLSSNNITGEIPSALMILVGLKNLNLSRNLLEGRIPMAIGVLQQLESLDLSMNRLSGQIPQSLGSLHFLSYLNLSFNNLSGPIPIGNQIQTLDDRSIFIGNNGLCGPPVSRSCNRNDVTNTRVREDEGDQNDTRGLWFWTGIGPGFFVGFMGLLGSLQFIRCWRVAYFEMLEKVYTWLMILSLACLRRNVFE